jgi:hypothetical protein
MTHTMVMAADEDEQAWIKQEVLADEKSFFVFLRRAAKVFVKPCT